jgi:hypothetical protein
MSFQIEIKDHDTFKTDILDIPNTLQGVAASSQWKIVHCSRHSYGKNYTAHCSLLNVAKVG